jgi:hypothetical protein
MLLSKAKPIQQDKNVKVSKAGESFLGSGLRSSFMSFEKFVIRANSLL